MTVGARQTVACTCLVSVKGRGPFKATMVLFLEDHGIREVPLSVSGIGVGLRENADGEPKP